MVILRFLGRLERIVPWVALVAAPLGLLLVLRAERDAIASINWTLSWRALALGATAYAIAPLMQGLTFWLALRLLTGRTPCLEALVVWARSYVVRYAPTGALAVAYRVSARHRLTASADQVLAAYAYEHVCVLAAGAIVFLAVFALALDAPPLLPTAIALATLSLTAMLRPGIAGRVLRRIRRPLAIQRAPLLGGWSVVGLVLLNVLGWLGTGAAVYLVVAGVSGGRPSPLWLLGAYAAGYLVGFVAPLAPGGIGVREGALIVLLGARFGTSAALAVSLVIRVANLCGELLAVTLVHAAYAASVAWRWATQDRYAPALDG
jgi:glycosyltransferase 2 family protein